MHHEISDAFGFLFKFIRKRENIKLKTVSSFSIDNIRQIIPSMVDGLRPSERKVLSSCFNIIRSDHIYDIKKSNLCPWLFDNEYAGNYETVISEVISKLAENFIGTNNLNLLQLAPARVGTRRHGGKDGDK